MIDAQPGVARGAIGNALFPVFRVGMNALTQGVEKSPLGLVGTAFDLAELMQRLVARKQLAGFEVKERFYEIGSREGLA